MQYTSGAEFLLTGFGDRISMRMQKRSSMFALCFIIALCMLCVSTTKDFSMVKSADAQLQKFVKPVTATATASAGPSSPTSSSSSSSSSDKIFSARLTGDKEVPPVDTDATARIRLIANSQQDALDYRLSVSNLNGVVTGAHIHRGTAATNGPIVANLNVGGTFASASAGDGGASTSTSTGGTITSADLKGPLAGKQISDLIKIIEDGQAYANVHTRQHPNGEIRGQLSSSSSSGDTFDEDGVSSSAGGASATASATAP
jgi:CHRD domain